MDYSDRILRLEKAQENNEIEHKEILDKLAKKDIEDALMRQQLNTLVQVSNRIEQKLDKQIEKQNEVPAKRWDTVITSIISTVIGAIIGAIVALLKK